MHASYSVCVRVCVCVCVRVFTCVYMRERGRRVVDSAPCGVCVCVSA